MPVRGGDEVSTLAGLDSRDAHFRAEWPESDGA